MRLEVHVAKDFGNFITNGMHLIIDLSSTGVYTGP